MSSSIETKALDFVDAAGKALVEAEKIASAQEATDAKLAELAPKIASQMVALKIIDKTLEEEAVKRLKTSEKVAEILGNVLTHYQKQANEKKASTEKTASVGRATPEISPMSAENANYTGKRLPPSAITPASDPLMKLAGIG